ncbi:MAG: SGNH/GDSL hydrolase family protein [Myxococcota bacterium]
MRFWAALLLVFCIAPPQAHAELPPLRPEVEAHVIEVRAHNPALKDDVFAKMGGSSVESKAFLHCLATPYVDLAGRDDLQETIDFFNVSRKNAFNRRSLSAGVSWNLRYALGGRPANFRKEIRDSDARWALVFFGANDAQNQNERIYLKRLVYLIEELEQMGVVPVLGAASPRRGKTRDLWIQRFNAITEAVALHWNLPYVDYYDAMKVLPRRGLARDGVHPNVMGRGGARAACQFTDAGLRYGNNVRNLMTLQVLDQLRRVASTAPVLDAHGEFDGQDLAEPEPEGLTEPLPVHHHVPSAVEDSDPNPDPGAAAAMATTADSREVVVPAGLPFSEFVDKETLPQGELPPGCGRLKPEARVLKVSVTVDEPTRLRAIALDLDGFSYRLFWIRQDPEGPRCVRRRNQALEVAAQPGLWDLIIEVGERAASEGRMLVLVRRDAR